MGIKNQISKISGYIGEVGLPLASALYPEDFEIYLMALELTDSKGNTIDYFSFPVMPDSIQVSELKKTNIKRTSSGVTVLTSDTFVPGEISIKGNFGKRFKIVLNKESSVEGVAFSRFNGKYQLLDLKNTTSLKLKEFTSGLKTGYGAVKILKSIISKSNGVDGFGYPFRLYLYNMALGESYLVTVPSGGFTVSQNIGKNMIWEYNLILTILAPLEFIKGQSWKTSLISNLLFGVLQKDVNRLARAIGKAVS